MNVPRILYVYVEYVSSRNEQYGLETLIGSSFGPMVR